MQPTDELKVLLWRFYGTKRKPANQADKNAADGRAAEDATGTAYVEQDRIRVARAGCAVDQHEGGGVIRQLRFLPKTFHGADTVDFTVLQKVRQHLQEVGFTTAEEARNPHADIGSRCVERF